MSKKIRCLVVDDEPMAREIICNYLQKIDALDLVGTCKNGMEAFQELQQEEVDLIFLDINMPELSGLSLAKALDQKTQVIFTTAYREYALEGFEVQALDYLLKPISFERFLKAIQKYMDVVVEKNASENLTLKEVSSIYIRADRKMVKINLAEVTHVESTGDYLKFHTLDKVWVTRDSLSTYEEKLPQPPFLRTHRSFLVNIQHIEAYTHELIEINHKAIPISRSYKNEVLAFLQNN
ncbi:LytTR family DNA-binding domain-containing protein [Mesonia sp. MT50]|uniref:LytTR family DNA-binding domain-containing protein n=1 Tax=Mesonia profundi TaxID=3070998 RepID=A0ABU1A0D7_9FLAO|nr:LytTR family DNA-binding domain-containing protein [Mesonia profundi]MDQ7917162.1 LytTR family DNA-binding domain-containing protein [Mesonia profundi]